MAGRVHVYTGDGKGKTTAALGLAVRAAGWGLRVRIVQFCKRADCGEHASLKKLGIECDAGEPVYSAPWDGTSGREWADHSRRQLDSAFAAMEGCDLLILDEILGAVAGGFLNEEDLRAVLDRRPAGLELALTGRCMPGFLLEQADLVTEMECVKHYYDGGEPARRGVEY